MSNQSEMRRSMNRVVSRRSVFGLVPALPIAIAAGGSATDTFGQAQTGPKANIVLRNDLQKQDNHVQESIVTLVEFPPTTAAPRHMHPGAQEIFYLIEGAVTVELEGRGARVLKAGEAALIPAEVPHLVRNDSPSIGAKGLAVHSRADKSKPLRVDL